MRPFYLLAPGLLMACSTTLEVTDKSTVPGTDAAPTETGVPVDTGIPQGVNSAPTADAGEDIAGSVPQEIELDGSGSADPDGDALNYDWVMIERPTGSQAFIINENRVNASFYADRSGTYIVELTVDDGEFADTDQVEINADAPNEGPVANAGPDQNVRTGDRVTLNGTLSYDPDGDELEYRWTLVSKPAGSTATLNDDTSQLPQFTADVTGAYVAELQVRDATSVSDPDSVRVIAATDSGGGGGGCFSCAGGAVQPIGAGSAASSFGALLLPMMVLLWRRREP
ncbi:MAG: PKD domain-containing protein [Myxococcales bacterium]|nr:PKD domain-containing protein [Myxococcales bacterium]